MKRDLWNELARRARLEKPAPVEMPFSFEEGVLSALRQAKRQPWNPLNIWLPILRPALGVAFAISMFCLFMNHETSAKPTTDFVSETESLIQMAVLNE